MRALSLLLALPLALTLACSSADDDITPTPVDSMPVASERNTTDRPDDENGPQVHLVYAIPSDGTDRELDTNGTIAASFTTAQSWLSGQTDGRALSLDTSAGEPDISFFQLSRTDADLQSEDAFTRDAIEAEMIAAGFDAPNKIYAVYFDGGSTYACGSGAYPPTLPGTVALLFLHGTPLNGAIQCGNNEFATDADSPAFWEFVIVHELMHTLGAVPDCAPNETMFGHINGPPNDLMYEGEEETDLPKALDPGHDDYFGHDNGGCLDVMDSPYLTP